MDHGIPRAPAVLQAEVDGYQPDGEADDLRPDDAQRLVEQLLAGLVTLQDDDGTVVVRC